MERPSVLLALPAAAIRTDLTAALEARGVAVRSAAGRAGLSAEARRGASAIVFDPACLGPETSNREALEQLCELVRLAAERPVFVTGVAGVPPEALLAAGAADLVDLAGSLPLAVHRIVSRIGAGAAPGRALGSEDFMGRLAERLVRAREREAQTPVFVLRAQVAGAGLLDELPAAIAEAVQHLERTTELTISASRTGTLALGDGAVAVFLPDLTRVQDAARFAGALRGAVARRALGPVQVGIACAPTDGADAESLVSAAHGASRRALREGQGELVFHTEAMGRWAFERLTLEGSLRNALQNGELVLYYQPRVDIETRQIRGMEALLRWIHPQFGLVSPAQFIPLAEETGLIVPIGEWIVGEAARQNRRWRDSGLPHIRVSVNLSPVQFRRSDLFERVKRAVEEAGLEPEGLELEVTESLLMNDPTQTAATLRQFKDFGFHLSIDDFGTGYSSLSYLKRFPIDALKIDRSFVTDVTSNPDDAAIATAIILMGHSLKLSVVAEGIETESQLAFLRVLQCNEAQGYLFSPPVPAAAATTLLASGVSGGALRAA